MTKDKKILYLTAFAVLAALLVVLFVHTESSKIFTACLLAVVAPIVCVTIKKRHALSINKKEVLLVSIVLATIFVILTQLSGIFFGFYKNPYFVSAQIFFRMILPITAIVVATEIIRYVFLSQKNKIVNVVTFVICVIAEVLTFSSIPGITSFNKFMDLVGLTLFPAASANVYYNYSSKHFGMFPNIAFRMITTLYVYFFPSVSGMSNALSSCIKIILPIIMYAFISALYEKKHKKAVKKGEKLRWLSTGVAGCIIIMIAMLISCQFRFGAIVIATESMTGEINKGDMIIYERYDGQQIKEGQVIVFTQNSSRIIHRVVHIEYEDNEYRYYTKGDANEDWDSGYITSADIVGLTNIKLAYVGFPTLWLRDIISK